MTPRLWIAGLALLATAHAATDYRGLARDIFQQLIEINTTDSVGDTTVAAEAMAMRLRAAGFPFHSVPEI